MVPGGPGGLQNLRSPYEPDLASRAVIHARYNCQRSVTRKPARSPSHTEYVSACTKSTIGTRPENHFSCRFQIHAEPSPSKPPRASLRLKIAAIGFGGTHPCRTPRMVAWSLRTCERFLVRFGGQVFSAWAAKAQPMGLARTRAAACLPQNSTPPTAAVHFLRVYRDWLGFHAPASLSTSGASRKQRGGGSGCGSSANVSPFSVSKQATFVFLPLLAMHASALPRLPPSSLDRHPRLITTSSGAATVGCAPDDECSFPVSRSRFSFSSVPISSASRLTCRRPLIEISPTTPRTLAAS